MLWNLGEVPLQTIEKASILKGNEQIFFLQINVPSNTVNTMKMGCENKSI